MPASPSTNTASDAPASPPAATAAIDIFRLIQSTDQAGATPLLELIRNGATFPEVRCYLDQIVHGVSTPDKASSAFTQDARLRGGYRDNDRGMDVQYLRDFAPVKVPARPWTTVTDDEALVSH
ncbi:hypothetical protein BDW62DRAFT_198057 [Aspergillus aurantiobrunneus]